ncbi:MAG: MATE family efflux transporter [Ignavibacteria bacterium]|jgi:putative MATE family efflux protein
MKNKIPLDENNINKLLLKLSMPAIIGMLVMSLYNVVDTIFVGQGVGTNGIGGVAIVFPLQMIAGAIGLMLGVGGASLLSRSLGENNIDKANKTLGNVLSSTIIINLVLTVIGYIFVDELLLLFGVTDKLLPYAKGYLLIILAGLTFQSLSMALNNLVRAEGHAQAAMLTMVIPAVVNIILDAVFIFGFNTGVKGAAFATIISQVIGTILLITFYLSERSELKIQFNKPELDLNIFKEIFLIGISVFIQHTAMSLLVVLINRKLGEYGGNIYIAVYGVVIKLVMLLFTPIIGIAQGLQPIVGFNYGSGNLTKMKKSLKLATIYSTIFALLGTAVVLLFPAIIIRIFSDDPELISKSKYALKFLLLAFPTVGFQVMGTTLFQATGKAYQTFLLSISRQILFLIPLIMLLPNFFQLTGVWISFPIADIMAAMLTFLMIIKYKHYFKASAIRLKTKR